MSVGAAPRLFRFGLFEADPENARLTRRGVRIRLQEQPFRILALLLQHPGQIVTREHLHRELWPAGTYVSFDSSLNAALNRLRTALDDDADNPRFIETVPKRGYRFIAPVTAEPSAQPAKAENSGSLPSVALGTLPDPIGAGLSPSPSPRSSLRGAGAASAVALVIAFSAFFAFRKHVAKSPHAADPPRVDIGSLRRSVAVLGFQNASGRPSDAWLSTALAEMLRTELGAGGKLRVVPGENVAQLSAGAPWSKTDSLSSHTASRIGKVLDSDLLVVGSFATLGDPQNASVRVDFRLQDAQTGEILYEGAESGSVKRFFGLVATVGTDLRERLGLPVISESEEAGVVSSLPSDPDANRFYSLGLEKAREDDVAAAKDLFLEAEKLAPRFPLVHLMLYRAWAGLGYDQKAKDEIKTAYQLSSGLPETDRLQIEGAYYESIPDRDKAISAYRALLTLYPDSVDYGEQLMAALNTAGRQEEALAVLKQLRKLPAPASKDPRIDFWQGQLAGFDEAAAQPFLEKAAEEASSRGQKLLYAHFRLHQCVNRVYGPQPTGGVAYCKEAYDIFMAAGDRLYAADALRARGDRRGSEGDMNGARELYQRALALLTPLGEHEKTGVVLNNMAITYENQGRLAQAEKLFRQAAETWTECGDLLHAAVATGNLGDILMEGGKLREAEDVYERAQKQIALTDPNGVAYELDSIASIRLEEGDMAGAKNLTEQALAMSRARKNVTDIVAADEVMGAVRIAADDLSGARDSLQQAQHIAQQRGSAGDVAETEASLAGVSLEEGNFSEAERALKTSLAEFRAQNALMNEIQAETDLSRALLREGKLAEARQTISDALALGANSPNPSLKLPATIMDARIQAAELGSRATKSKPNFAAAQRKLWKVVLSARQLGYYSIECDARLALAELEVRENSPYADRQLAQLATDARARGLTLVSRKAATLADSAAAPSNRRLAQVR